MCAHRTVAEPPSLSLAPLPPQALEVWHAEFGATNGSTAVDAVGGEAARRLLALHDADLRHSLERSALLEPLDEHLWRPPRAAVGRFPQLRAVAAREARGESVEDLPFVTRRGEFFSDSAPLRGDPGAAGSLALAFSRISFHHVCVESVCMERVSCVRLETTQLPTGPSLPHPRSGGRGDGPRAAAGACVRPRHGGDCADGGGAWPLGRARARGRAQRRVPRVPPAAGAEAGPGARRVPLRPLAR